MSKLIQQLNKNYFWDVNIALLDKEKSKRLIIERTLNFGTLNEIKLVMDFYGRKTVASILCNLNYIDPKTLNFVSLLFQIPKTKFKCYTRAQSISQRWNY
ncbi:MAG: hypothetical protein PF694_01645 [Bacteroidetes bacterium]|jgi:hypothetical protein|nr:hypothetical protein [Bacteroidota bacterium]